MLKSIQEKHSREGGQQKVLYTEGNYKRRGNAVSHKTDLANTASGKQAVSLWRHHGRDPTSSPEK